MSRSPWSFSPPKAAALLTLFMLSLPDLKGTAWGQTPDFAAAADEKGRDIKPQDVILWDGFQAGENADGTVTATLRMTTEDVWKIYATNLKFSGPPGFEAKIATPPPSHRFMDPISNHEVEVYEGGEFALSFTGAPRWQGAKFPIGITYVGCTNSICLFPYTQTVELAYLPFAPVAAVAQEAKVAQPEALNGAAASPEGDDLETRLAHQFQGGGLSFLSLVALVFVGGLLSNLTPCVAPLIPITMRLLAKQGKKAYTSAIFYALGIVFTYSALGLAAALSGGLFGSLLASKTFNIGFALCMALLGLSMLGYGDLSKLQMLGSRLGSGKPSHANAFLMGCGAGLVAAPCTGPILAALLAYTAKNNAGVGPSTFLLTAYSVGFSLPYIFLGSVAAKATTVRVNPRLQVATKLTFASIMFGLAFYYLRVPLYTALQPLHSAWQDVAIACLSLGILALGVMFFVPGLSQKKAFALVPTFFLGLGIFGASQWATHDSGKVEAGGDQEIVFHTEAEAFAFAKTSQKPILIDMWAEWCEACKKMDATTFTDPQVKAQLAKDWVILKLDFTESNAVNDHLQEKYGVQSLPTLIMLPATAELGGKQAINGFTNASTLNSALAQFPKQKAE